MNRLPKNTIEKIATLLDIKDAIVFGSCSKRYQNAILKNESFWRNKTLKDFGNLFRLYQIFITSTGLELPSDLSEKFAKRPHHWFQYYIYKHTSLKRVDNDILLDQCDKEYKEAQRYLTAFQDEIDYSLLTQLASRMFWILDIFPTYAGCYYILGYILFFLKQFGDALDILDMGRCVDASFQQFDELEKDIISTMQTEKRARTDVPLLVNENLSPELIAVLLEIFHRFDKDQDNCLNFEELDFFVYSTNGQHPPTSFLEQMGQRYGSNNQGWLTKEGFLAFYLEQTLDDVHETRKDIRAHGYDCSKLRKRDANNA
ncbi:uncharacterized protein B0P05DRAFT_541501 [Gilbertella persicaria]|uniref:uncharacterized protein n=1 Tax=Gilbertella persicaria TaxID=101096 RepID=UPI00221E4742|nr:uncharacterized protein B0P05DRAFT_541501 [Gilbertella persicaria]KAI8079659.1 hypothetical protein B0P05DRAFT_541501 [Gilbertella persicaria]